MRRGGGEARAAAGSREEEDREREKNEEGWGEPIYKERCEETGVKIKETRIMTIQINGRLDSRKALKNKRYVGR